MLVIECRNERDTDAVISLGANYEENLRILATFPDGHQEQLRQPVKDGVAAIGQLTLAPHGSATRRLLLNKLVDLRSAGYYTFQLSLAQSRDPQFSGDYALVENEIVHLFVDARDEKLLDGVCAGLLEKAKSSDIGVSGDALVALGYTRDPIAIAYLGSWLQTEKTSSLDFLAFNSLGLIGGDEAARLLLAELGAPMFSLEGQRTLRARAAGVALGQLLPTIRDEELRKRARAAIGA